MKITIEDSPVTPVAEVKPEAAACPHHIHVPADETVVPIACDASVPVIPQASYALPFVRVATDTASGKASLVPVDAASFDELLKAAPDLTDARKQYNYLWPWYDTRDQEHFLVLLFDIRHQLRGIGEVALGQRSTVRVGIDDLIRLVTCAGAERFNVWHNHPSGVASPSPDDRKLTKTIRGAFKAMPNIMFQDHGVAARDGFYSFYEKSLFEKG